MERVCKCFHEASRCCCYGNGFLLEQLVQSRAEVRGGRVGACEGVLVGPAGTRASATGVSLTTGQGCFLK